MLKVGDTFTRIHFNSTITIKEVITHKKELGGKKVKLEHPLYIMVYERWITKTERKMVEVPMTEENIQNQLNYELWKKK